MFSEILKINPKLDNTDLNKMESQLSGRFGKIAKKFGSGLKTALSIGGIASIGLALIEKVLNPLKEIQDQIEKTLHRADDLKTNAEQFGTTSGNLFKLQTLAQAHDVAPDQLNLLIGKFQVAVAQALADPSKQTSVRNFAFQGADTAESFFQFIQAVNKLPKEQQTLAQAEVFGEKQMFKAAEFFNEKDFTSLSRKIGLAPSETYTKKIDRAAELSYTDKILKANLAVKDLIQSADKISEKQVLGINVSQGVAESRTRNRIDAFDKIKTVDDSINTITALLTDSLLGIQDMSKALRDITAIANKIPGAKLMRGILPGSKDN